MIYALAALAAIVLITVSLTVYSVAYNRGYNRAFDLVTSTWQSTNDLIAKLYEHRELAPDEYMDDNWSDPYADYEGDGWWDFDQYGDNQRQAVEHALRAEHARETAAQVEREEKAYGKTAPLPHHGSVHID